LQVAGCELQVRFDAPQPGCGFSSYGFDPNDIQKYLTTNKLPNVPVKARNVNGYGGGVNDLGVELEAVLEIDMIIGINPAVKEVLGYEDGDDPFGVATNFGWVRGGPSRTGGRRENTCCGL
jgi:hypothetical protein